VVELIINEVIKYGRSWDNMELTEVCLLKGLFSRVVKVKEVEEDVRRTGTEESNEESTDLEDEED